MNTQVTENYVSYETAKLLKEKEFDWEWSPFYSEQDKDEWAQNNNYNIPNPNYDPDIPFDSEMLNVIAPHVSLQTALKWLREVHTIDIVITPSMFRKKYNTIIYKDENLCCVDFDGATLAPSYEYACEAAIKYCLENLI